MDEVIAGVAAKQGIEIGNDDPILVLHTLNAQLLNDSAAAQQALLEAYRGELEAVALRWRTDATLQADHILLAALTAGKETMAANLQEGAVMTAAWIQTEVNAALDRVAMRLQAARRIAALHLVAACIRLAAAGIVVMRSLPPG